ncbi:hypothetical protein MNBD_GAMMA22-2142 [hydrothermal vent metagenome]|uniref:Cyclic di-GMP receptor atypical PilZ domain-containing protein n=1 Tax=hydrothermal vent metagenome TaxID=652676 RepID=A0A3B1AJP9_9ZZZZ
MTDQKISIVTRLAIQWQNLDELKPKEKSDFSNASAIQLLDILEGQSNLHSFINSNNQTKQSDIARLESKLDLLLLMFSRSQYNHQYSHIPDFEVCLSAQSIQIKTSNEFKLNQFVEMNIFFNRNCSEPLLLSGTVTNVDSINGVSIKFDNIGELTQSFLEKYIFRLHRIDVARVRSLS